ncbi:MAG: DUF1461 domain-containing protein [Coriobacteriia bacterium]|nr:DUF1461 domain-containing protein [Coriobacteriia bacterium]
MQTSENRPFTGETRAVRRARKKQDVQAGFDYMREAAREARTQDVAPPTATQAAAPATAPTPTPEKLAALRYQYQGQGGFDASEIMAARGDDAKQMMTRSERKAAQRAANKKGQAGSVEVDSPWKEEGAPDAVKEGQAARRSTIIAWLLASAFAVLLVVASLGASLGVTSFQPVVMGVLSLTHQDRPVDQTEAFQRVGTEVLRYVTTLPFEELRGISASQQDKATLGLPDFTEDEICHLTDVRLIMGPALLASYILAVIAVTTVALTRNSEFARRSTFMAGIACLVLPLVMGAFMLVAFEPTFVAFHEVFFPQGNWTFPADSLIISTFPGIFWQMSGLLWMAVFMLNGALLMILSRFCGELRALGVTND